MGFSIVFMDITRLFSLDEFAGAFVVFEIYHEVLFAKN